MKWAGKVLINYKTTLLLLSHSLSLSLSPHLSGKSEFLDGELGMLGEPLRAVPFLMLSYSITCIQKRHNYIHEQHIYRVL